MRVNYQGFRPIFYRDLSQKDLFRKRSFPFSVEKHPQHRISPPWPSSSSHILFFLLAFIFSIHLYGFLCVFIFPFPLVQIWLVLLHFGNLQTTRTPPRNPLVFDLLGRSKIAVKIAQPREPHVWFLSRLCIIYIKVFNVIPGISCTGWYLFY